MAQFRAPMQSNALKITARLGSEPRRFGARRAIAPAAVL